MGESSDQVRRDIGGWISGPCVTPDEMAAAESAESDEPEDQDEDLRDSDTENPGCSI